MQTTGSSEQECWRAMHHVSSRMGFLGIQFAARKMRPPMKNARPWAGSVLVLYNHGVGVKCTQEKWDKARELMRDILEQINSQSQLNRKHLEKSRGFMVHVQQTYLAITPYLKGLHLTIDSWRLGREKEGWKVSGSPGFGDDNSDCWVSPCCDDGEAPDFVIPVPHLKGDIINLLM
jgi:hypothetical protein